MSWPKAKLSDVAPAKPLRKIGRIDEDHVLQITLDHIESDSGRLLKRNYAPVSEAGSSTHWFDNRYVLYSKLRPYLNKVYLPDELGIGTTELVPMLPNDQVLDRKYLAYFLRSKTFVDWVSSQTAGAKMPRVSMKVFWDYEIPLPPLAEQERIAAILDKADAIRRKRQQAIQLADDFLRAVFLDMFGKYVTADGYAEADKAKIRDLVDYIDYRGKTPTKSESGIPLITAKNVKKGFVDVEPREYIPAENYEAWMTRGLPQENDVLFTTEAPLGNVALLGKYEKVVVGQRLIALRSKGRVTHEFLMHLLLDPFVQGLIMNRSSGSTVKGIRTKELYEIELPIPDIDRQVEFSSIYWKIKSLTQKDFISSGWNEDVFNSLSQRAFSGRL